MIKNLFLIRHGEAEHLVGEKLTGGWTNSYLTETGKRQALSTGRYLEEFLKGNKVSLYSSDFFRAKETADIIGRSIGSTAIPLKELREINNGDAANLTRKEAEKMRNQVTTPLIDWIPYPNAESWRMMNDRIVKVMDEINNKQDENVVIISHNRTIVSIIHWWLEFDLNYITKISFDIDPCSITQLRINKWNEKTISRLNDTAHLLIGNE